MEALTSSSSPGGVSLPVGETPLGPVFAVLMDELAHGLLVTTLHGRLLHANKAAQLELARRRVLGASHELLHACTSDGVHTLHDALAKAADGKRSLIELTAAEGAALTLAVVPLQPDEAGGVPRVALLLARESVCESLMLCLFGRSHALTATEEHVLGILCQGFSAPEVAVQMQVAVSTVRSHVRSLCAKTGTSGVRQLVNRVAVLPPVAPRPGHHSMH